ncbi:MAG: dihydrolipoamide acetyltransferase family protein [Steroidobacteraceae bacterium]
MTRYVFKLPDLGEGTVEAEIVDWRVAVGDHVDEDTVLCEVMTEKASVEVPSPVAGKVVAINGEPGTMLPVGSELVVFETDATAPADHAANPATTVSATAGPQTSKSRDQAASQAGVQQDAPRQRVMTSPAVRRRAKEAGVDLAAVAGSGPGGRITAKDFDTHLAAGTSAGPGVATQAATRAAVEEIRIIGLRRLIAERMSEAKRNIPHFAYVEEVDVTELEKLRAHLNRQDPARDPLSILPLIVLGLVRTLARFPQCNCLHDSARNVLLRHSAVHVGVATQTADGLKVPVVRHAERRRLRDLATEIRRVADLARSGRARKEDLTGSTITVTSLGKLGGIVSTPVINAPEVAIIGVNRVIARPVVVDGAVVVRSMMNLSSSFDHRFVDGYDAAAMIADLRQRLEQPALMFAPDGE